MAQEPRRTLRAGTIADGRIHLEGCGIPADYIRDIGGILGGSWTRRLLLDFDLEYKVR